MDQERTCVVCARLARPRGDDGIFVAALSESIAILADDQFYPGYCILMLKDHHEQLAQLPAPRQARLCRRAMRPVGCCRPRSGAWRWPCCPRCR